MFPIATQQQVLGANTLKQPSRRQLRYDPGATSGSIAVTQLPVGVGAVGVGVSSGVGVGVRVGENVTVVATAVVLHKNHRHTETGSINALA